MANIIKFGTLKNIFNRILQPNLSSNYASFNPVVTNALHTSPQNDRKSSKRFTRCNKCCEKQYKTIKDKCCELKPISKRPAQDPRPKPKAKKKKHITCAGGMLDPCLQKAYQRKCSTQYSTCDCPPYASPPCPKGDWNRGDE